MISIWVTALVAHAEHRDLRAGQIHVVELVVDILPVVLDLADIPGRDAADDKIVARETVGPDLGDIVVGLEKVFAELVTNQFGGGFGLAGTGSVKQGGFHGGEAFVAGRGLR